MSYFRQVYRRCSNFSMESMRQTFMTKPVIETSRAQFSCRISRIGDLLQQVYLSFELPNIYSDDELRFRWVKNIANHMLYSYSVRIDTQVIDRKWGEWLDIWNELSLPYDKRMAYERMSGNDEDYVNPKSYTPLVSIRNNRLFYSSYRAAANGQPSIPKRRCYVPLDFWFSKNPALALPLIALQYQIVEVTIELRGIEELYQVYDRATDTYVSPSEYRARNPGVNVSYSAFSSATGTGPTTVDLNAYLDCNFIFLDEAERRVVASKSMDYLVERVYRIEQTGVGVQNTIDLQIANPVKEFVWFARRNDYRSYNEYANFTAKFPENANFPIMSSAKLVWNGLDRIEDKPAEYFGYLQPYQHHTSVPSRGGIYSYSFALFPEKLQPSGSFNASMIQKIQLYVVNYAYPDVREYEYIVFVVYYNIFRVMNGSGGMVFQS